VADDPAVRLLLVRGVLDWLGDLTALQV